MGLDSYGVLVGDFVGTHRDTPDNQGKWFHVHVMCKAGANTYDCAVDVDSKKSEVGVEWRVVPLEARDVAQVLALGDGYHPLASTSSSGAIDYQRSEMLRVRSGCVFALMPSPLVQLLSTLLEGLLNAWTQGSHADASVALEGVLAGAKRCIVWGEPYDDGGHGMHNVHQNQGDPAGSQWWDENAIWQDGGTVVEKADGSWVAFISKFTSQARRTDDQGHPA